MATVLARPNPVAVFPRNRSRPLVRPRLVPECISVLSEDDETMDVCEDPLPPPAMPAKPRAKNAIVSYVPKPAPAPARTGLPSRALARNRAGIPRAPRSKVVQPHRNALALHRPSGAIVKRQTGHLTVAGSALAPPRVSVDETRSVIEAAVRDAHLDRYMLRNDVVQAIACELRRRGYVDSVINLLMQTSYNLFNVNSVYYDTFEKQTVCVYKDGDWVPYTITHYNLFDGFQAYRINDQQCVERVSINNHVKWKWPE